MDRFLEYIVLHEKEGVKYDKDCVLLLTPNNLWDDELDLILDEDLYKEGDKYGKENESHITLLYGLLPGKYNDTQIYGILFPYTKINYTITGIGVFENEDKPYDVVKFDIQSDDCNAINEELKKLPYQNDFPEYHPHITLAYVKKGLGDKYKTIFGNRYFDEPRVVNENRYEDCSTKVKLSKASGEKQIFDLTDNLIQQEIIGSAMISTPPGDYSFYQDKEKNK